jgi:DNA-binding NtrC family response regulator
MSAAADDAMTLQEGVRQFKRRFVREALERREWNVRLAAQDLDLARGHLYHLIAELDLKR